jgi:type IV pilus assembly protein PilY1
MSSRLSHRFYRILCWALVALQGLFPAQQAIAALTNLTDQPLFVTNSVPPNLMLVLSVEWPTGVVAAYNDNANTTTGYTCPGRSNSMGVCYFEARRYLGYFDPERCYSYYQSNGGTLNNKPDVPSTKTTGRNAAVVAQEYFRPTGSGSGTYSHLCDGKSFSGNYLNWATMHSIDEFRFAMTGGDRFIDTTSKTVIEKARQTGDGGNNQFPIKYISNNTITVSKTNIAAAGVANVTPFSSTNLYARIVTSSELNYWSDNATRGRILEISDVSDFTTNATFNYKYIVRVQVCDQNAPGGLEYNGASDYQPCQPFTDATGTTYYKPTGLIQKNASRMRFGVSAYQYDSTQTQPKGVLRARMKSVGPQLAVPSGTPGANANMEWNSDGTQIANPDSNSIGQSGVINYLNKFGKTNGYITYDTLSELYYAALRAVRNLDPPSDYVANLTTASYDGFPIYTTRQAVDDSDINARPIQYACQRTNFVGIADANTHTDVDLPGNTNSGYSGHPTGSGVSDPAGINVTTLDNQVGTLEGIGNIGTMSAGRSNTYHAAGLAYWANTQDILQDDPTKPWTIGKQTAQTYWMDVRETGSDGPVNSQMWLAAKYGGFSDINGDGKPANVATWHTNSDTLTGNTNTKTSPSNNGLRPDNWFSGDRPDTMIQSLQSIFNSVLSKSLSSSGASLSAINFQTSSNGGAYTVQYNSADWTGDVLGNTITVNAAGTPTVSNVWSAQSKLDIQAQTSTFWSSGRFIATYDPAKKAGVAFQLTSLNATQQGYLGASADQQSMLNYLRGNRSDEGTKYRVRTHLLGDIINSEATAVAPPSAAFSDAFNPGYGAFKTANASRATMVYVGSNDGMMHAINGDVSGGSGGGQEKWAYIPSFVLSGPSIPATPSTDGLAARARLTGFVHKYYVDQTPYVQDVDFSRTSGGTASAGGDWHTILVAGLNKGGRGFYALDISDPAAVTSEAAVASKVLWEFSDEDMGYSYGRPIIAKTAQYGWVVILSSGYNNVNGSNSNNRGRGYLYILNAKTGALLQKISTGAGTESNPSGFAHPAAFIPVTADYTIDYVYGGDLLGNVWRFDLTSSSGTYPAPTLFAQSTAPSGAAQMITVEPKIEIGANGNDRWVFVGTGKMLSTEDLTSVGQNTFYAFRDGSRTQVYGTGAGKQALPTGVTFPIGRDEMVQNTDLTLGVKSTVAQPMGWYYDLLSSSEKITTSLVANEGLVSWTAYLPATDPCAPGATSRTYVTDYDYGISRISVNNLTVQYLSSSSYLVKVQFVKDSSGKIRAVLTTGDPTTSGGQIQGLPGRFGRDLGVGTRVNWREILD